jgi:lysosomal acid lipase/cholesteryl ester hydrolase
VPFWNFSIDEFAFHDIPDSIEYILEATQQESLSYIGFSQGTAQAFATLAIHPKLNDKVNVFIALAPAMSPAGLSNGIVDALVKASPQILFLLFGRRSILSSATMWQSILYPPIFTKVIDMGLSFLFAWKTANIATSQKLAAYPHLYSYTSTKSVVHWFQIIRTQSFQMYDDDVHPPLSRSSKHTKVAKYPTRNIKTPIVLVYGGSDSLVDIEVMLSELPAQTVATEIPHYEHLDFLWARDVDEQVFRHVFDALESFTGAEHTKEEYERYRSARHTSLSASTSFRRHDKRSSDGGVDSDFSAAPTATEGDEKEIAGHRAAESRRFVPRAALAKQGDADDDSSLASSPGAGEPGGTTPVTAFMPGTAPPSLKFRSNSGLSIDSMKEGKGIKLGAGKAVKSINPTVITGNEHAATSSVEPHSPLQQQPQSQSSPRSQQSQQSKKAGGKGTKIARRKPSKEAMS